ncbi:unnamed protein product [Caenorhabditis nigoni]
MQMQIQTFSTMVNLRFPPGLFILIILPIFLFRLIQTKPVTLENAENASDSEAVQSSTPTHSAILEFDA